MGEHEWNMIRCLVVFLTGYSSSLFLWGFLAQQVEDLPNHISRGVFYLLTRRRAVAIAKFSGITMGMVPEWPTTIQLGEISLFTLDWLIDGWMDGLIDWLTGWLMDHVQSNCNQVASYLQHCYFHWTLHSLGDFHQCETTGSKTRWRGSTERRVLSIGAQRTALFHLFLGVFFNLQTQNGGKIRGTSQGSNKMLFKDMWNNTVWTSLVFFL